MNSFSNMKRGASLAGKLALACASLCLAATTALAAPDTGNGNGVAVGVKASGGARPAAGKISPSNSSVFSARALVPDGSSSGGYFGTDAQQWFMFYGEPGKTYVIDFFDPYSDNGGGPDGIAIYDGDGTTTPPPETSYNCTRADRAPGVNLNFGFRCVLRMFAPTGTTLQNRAVFVKVLPFFSNSSYQIRVSEAGMYGRWTTNGYDFHIEMQNTTGQAVCAQVYLYANSGLTYSGGVWTGGISYLGNFTIPAYGANKTVVASNTTVGPDKRGTWRITACAGTENLTPGALNVSTYAFNPGINQYLYFFPSSVNGNGGNAGSY